MSSKLETWTSPHDISHASYALEYESSILPLKKEIKYFAAFGK